MTRTSPRSRRSPTYLALILTAVAAGCGDDGGGGAAGDAGLDDPRPADAAPADAAPGSIFVIASAVFDPGDMNTYLNVLGGLGAQTIDYKQARSFPGFADLWVHEGAVFVASSENKNITKFDVVNGQLVERGVVSFLAHGPTEFGFYRNIFATPTKAYFINGASQYILWNPADMTITRVIDLPVQPAPAGLMAYPGYSDRAAHIRDGRIFQPIYFTDASYFKFAPDSRVLVFDIASDTVVDVLPAGCPGLDYVTADEAGDLFFSSWVFAAGGALVLQQPATCVFRVPASGAPGVAFSFPAVAGGRQGAAFHYLRGGRAFFSALHGERVTITPGASPSEITYGANWRFWTYDLRTGAASPVEAVDWNAGSHYSFAIDGKTYMLLAAGDYSATRVYDVGDSGSITPLFDTRGWATRLFKVR